MISRLRGQLIESSIGRVVLDVNGVGYEISVPATTELGSIGSQQNLYTRQIVREDSLSLFGFGSSQERHLFDLLCSVSGVGPRSALAILSSLEVHVIETAISTDNDQVFRQVPGIGPKTAKLICVSLASKISILTGKEATPSARQKGQDVIGALVGLGWKASAAEIAVLTAIDSSPTASDSELLRTILRELGSKKAASVSDE